MTPLIIAFIWLSLTHTTEAKPNCRPLQVNFCEAVGYTSSAKPSGALGYVIRDIRQIVESACDPDVAILMCRVVVPECGAENDSRLKPCRSLCERVKSSCEAALKAKRITWPSRLRCERLPEDNCVQGSGVTRACEPIKISLCKSLPYNLTVMPNVLGHYTQDEANLEAQLFWPLVEVGCSPELKEFLCSVFAPECVDGIAHAPCRRVCERARAGCKPLMTQFGFVWPEKMSCEKFTTDTCDPEPDPTLDPTQGSAVRRAGAEACEPIKISLCKGLPYNLTVMPNVLGHQRQDVANIEAQIFWPLIEMRCSPVLKEFLCSLYAPECVDGIARAPCRRVCERARAGCASIMTRIMWPEQMSCEKFTTDSCYPGSEVRRAGAEACEPIKISLCQGLSYNLTVMPNVLGHQSQGDANIQASTFAPLVQVGCSPEMKKFLCSVYAPECVDGIARAPCRRMCERARAGCEPILTQFGFVWPEQMNCEKFTTDTCDPEPDLTLPPGCEPISVPMCSDMPYTQTILPNSLGQRSQQQITQELLQHFYSLVQMNCSPALKPFLCSVYTPECVEGKARPPCRTLCEEARAACAPLMNGSMSWTFNCDAYGTESCPHGGDTESSAEQILQRLNRSGFSLYGNSLTQRTADLLLTLADADKSGGLNSVEYFNMEHFVATAKREYVEMNRGRTPPAVTEDKLLSVLVRRGLIAMDRNMLKPLWRLYRNSDGNSIDFDDYVAVVARLQVLRDRFEASLLNLPCDCQVASFSHIQFLKAAIV